MVSLTQWSASLHRVVIGPSPADTQSELLWYIPENGISSVVRKSNATSPGVPARQADTLGGAPAVGLYPGLTVTLLPMTNVAMVI